MLHCISWVASTLDLSRVDSYLMLSPYINVNGNSCGHLRNASIVHLQRWTFTSYGASSPSHGGCPAAPFGHSLQQG